MNIRGLYIHKVCVWDLAQSTYPLRHLMNVCSPMVIVENHHGEDDRGGHHEHDAVEVCPCNSAARPLLSYQINARSYFM